MILPLKLSLPFTFQTSSPLNYTSRTLPNSHRALKRRHSMHIPNLSPFQLDLMAIRRVGHRLEHTQHTHTPHRLINHIPPINIRGFIPSRDPHITRICICSFTSIRTALHATARYTPRNDGLSRVLGPQVEVCVCGCLDRGAGVALSNGDGIPVLF